jgi:predicted ATPase/class 3 adenylate cyclase
MHKCRVCGHANASESLFCSKCGAMFASTCPTCGKQVPDGNRFCGQCGTRLIEPQPERKPQDLRDLMPTSLADKIRAAAAEVVGERREVTVLFVDIANFTATAHDLDSEDVYLLTDQAMRILAQVVYKYEGTIDKYTGDGLMALFGAPVTHENDPERAVRAALEMQTALQPLQKRAQRQYGVDIQVRIGVNTGQVIAGHVGGDLHMEYTVIGDTVNLASRLENAAEPGTVLVSFSTYQRTRPFFKYEALPPFAVKGKPEPVRAFQPLHLRATPGQVRGLPGLQVPMIGREDAMALLRKALAQVRQEHHPRIGLISGEAGVGKSRLALEFRQAEAASTINFYQGICQNYTRLRPLWLVASLLRDIIQLSENAPSETQQEVLAAYLRQMDLAENGLLPYLSHVLGLQQTDPSLEARLGHLDNTVLVQLTHAAVRQVLLAEARLTPTVLIFEDLHWVDPASRDFVEYLIQTAEDVPLMLVLISRDAERETVIKPLIAAAQRHSQGLVDIQLQRLSHAEGQALVSHLIQTTTEDPALKRYIAERAEGNPFYAEEIVRMLIEGGGLERVNGTWQTTAQAETLVREVPGTLTGLILARFDRLAPDLRRTLQKAAVLGSSFPFGLLLNLNGTSPDAINSQIAALEARQFLIPTPFGLEKGYAFRHALIQEVVYNTLLKRDRKQLHAKAARAIEQSAVWTPDERTEALAHHYSQGPDPAKAIPYLIAAAHNAARSCAYETAIQRYRQASALIEDKNDCDSGEFVRIQIGLGQARKFVGEYAKARQTIEQALQRLLHVSLTVESATLISTLVRGLLELADIRVREGAPDRALRHLQAGLDALGVQGEQNFPALWRSLMDRMAWVSFRQGKLDEAFRLASSATLRLDTEENDDPTTLASLYNTLGGVLWQQGNVADATTYVERSLKLYEGMGHLWGMANAHTNLGVLYVSLGDWAKAARTLETGESLQVQIGDLQNRALTLNNLGVLRQRMGEHKAARNDLETSLSIRRRLGDAWGIGQTLSNLARLFIVQSRFEDAAAFLKEALGMSDALGAYEAEARSLLALVQAEEDIQKALNSAQEALAIAQATEFTEAEVECRRVLGVLHARAADYLEAEVLLRESVDLCIQLDTPYSQGLALLELGRLYAHLAGTGASSQAEWQVKALTAYSEAIGAFRSLGAAHDLQLAQTALSQLPSGPITDIISSTTDIDEPGAAPVTAASHLGLPDGEWRTAAVVWLRLIPPADADEEDIFETTALVMPALLTIAEEFEGRVVRRQDGLTVVFGAPTAYEDDAERAVKTAAHMAQYLQQPPQHARMALSSQIAVSLGDLVAGQVGSDLHTEFVVEGEPVRLAQQVAQAATAGQVWVTEAVRAATERVFIYEARDLSADASLPELSLWTLVREREQPAPARGLPGLRARFIGREAQLLQMKDLSRNLSQGIGGLVWIEGEPGIGKSRLIREFSAWMGDAEVLVWSGRCSPQKSGTAFALLSDLLAQALDVRPLDTPDQIRAKIDQALQQWPRDTRMTRPYLEMLLGVWPSGLDGERMAGLEPEQLRQQTFVTLRRLCKSLAGEKPLVITLDDLHWVDPVSAELLGFLLTIVASAPILFVCAQRRQGADSPNDRLVRLQCLIPTQTVGIRLDRLSPEESHALLTELLSEAALPTTLKRNILQQSEGNPYFIEEYVRMLIEQGYLQRHDDGWQVDPAVVLDTIPLPTSLETLIRSRVDALPSELKELMQCAAVVGAPFEANLLATVSEGHDVEADLARLESRLLVRRDTESNRWAFNHSLIESVVYSAMLKARRRTLHLRAAQALEARWAGAEADHAEELAYHYVRGEDGPKALNYLMQAGERATARYANEEAIAYFEQAAQLLKAHPDTADRLRWRLAAGLGDVYRSMGRYADSTAALEAGLALVETGVLASDYRVGLFRRLGETTQKQGDLDTSHMHFTGALALLGAPTDNGTAIEAARILTGLAWTYFLQGRFDQALETCEASLIHARRAGALNELAAAENILGGIHYRRSEWALASQHTRRAMVLREQMGYTWGVAATLSNLGVVAILAGDWNKGRSFLERSLALNQEVGNVEGVTIVHNNLGTLLRDQGDLDQAELHFRESLAVARPFEMGFHIANSTIGLAEVLLLKGALDAAEEAIQDCLAQAEAIGAHDLRGEIHRIQAEILMAHADWDAAREAAEKAASQAAETGNRSQESAAWRVRSEIELRREDPTAARSALGKAQLLAGEITDELEAGRVKAQSGQIHLYEGNHSQAEADLRAAKTTFMRLGAKLDLKRVESALFARDSHITHTQRLYT